MELSYGIVSHMSPRKISGILLKALELIIQLAQCCYCCCDGPMVYISQSYLEKKTNKQEMPTVCQY